MPYTHSILKEHQLNKLAHDILGSSDMHRYLAMNKEERDLRHLDVKDRSQEFVMAADSGSDNAIDWVSNNREGIMAAVGARGWLLIRGLGVSEPTGFRKCISQLKIPLVEEYGDLPMSPSDDGTSGVFNVTKYPSKNAILFHNEGSHTHQPPRFIFFQCSIAALQDGETPLANSTDVYYALPEEIRDEFAKRGLLYRRNFMEGLDVPWTKYFGTQSREAVEAVCAQHDVKTTWLANGGLVTEIFRPAVINHPDSGALSFFNQILLHHPACLDPEVRKALKSMLNGACFPRDVLFGDGTSIPDEWVAEILRAHMKVAMCFRWQAGDVVVVDNLAISHARRPYSGPRQHHVILAR
jgi:alpha-ketoglutarate-dependent taurine dioxygenase